VTHFCHFYKFPTSQRKPTARHTVGLRALAHTQASLPWPRAGRASGPARAAPSITGLRLQRSSTRLRLEPVTTHESAVSQKEPPRDHASDVTHKSQQYIGEK